MDKFVINGGNRLEGKVTVSGAKNSALKLMAASLLTKETCLIRNIPDIKDVQIMTKVLEHLGAKVKWLADRSLQLKADNHLIGEAPYELVNQMRASVIVLGPVVARFGRARVALPGGCNIGLRKLDLHLRGLEALGSRIELEHGFIEAEAPRLRGALISLDFPSVGATENLLMAAVLAKGTTVIENAAREPEICDLVNFLKKMGAKIKGAGTPTLTIEGVEELRGAEYTVVTDRIEAGTFMTAAAITGGDVLIQNIRPNILEMVMTKLREAGITVVETGGGIRVTASTRPKAIEIATLPYPGFPTDMQPQIMSLLSIADGTSIITENVFESRFLFVEELIKMGSDIRCEGHHAVIKGVDKLYGTTVTAMDLRGGAALVTAALASEGQAVVENVEHIDRGYEDFEKKLKSLGADITRLVISEQ